MAARLGNLTVVAPPLRPARKHTVTRFPYQRLSDAELVHALAQGDEQGIGAVWDRHSPLVRGVLRSGLGVRANVEGLLLEVFLDLVQAASELRSGDSLRPYLVALAVQRVLAELRGRRLRPWRRGRALTQARAPSDVLSALEPALDPAAFEQVPDALHAAGRARLIARAHEPRPAAAPNRRGDVAWVGGACATIAALAAGAWFFSRSPHDQARDLHRVAIRVPATLPRITHEPTADERPKASPAESWSELVQRGAFEAVVTAASTRGVQLSTSIGSAEDLSALAEATRYTGHPDLAKRALLALRERFPHSPESASAPFLLGQLHESAGELNAADRWYRVYLAEAAQGEHTADALAGRMRSVEALEGTASAKALALEYLRRFPNGVQIALAHRLAAGR